MARIDVDEYRQKYLEIVRERIIARKDSVSHYSTDNLTRAILSEMNRADEETWEVEVPDDKEQAINEAEQRVLEVMSKNIDLGTGKSF